MGVPLSDEDLPPEEKQPPCVICAQPSRWEVWGQHLCGEHVEEWKLAALEPERPKSWPLSTDAEDAVWHLELRRRTAAWARARKVRAA